MSAKKILVATDFSEPANDALAEAHELALRLGAELYVFHAVPNLLRTNPLFPEQNMIDALGIPHALEQAADRVERRVTRLTGRSADTFHVVVDHGSADTLLFEHSEALGVDVIVVGSRGFTGLRHVMLGSVAERVVRFAKADVWVARPSPNHGHVLAATDFSDPAMPAVAAAADEARRRNAKLTVMHCLGVAPSFMTSAAGPLGGGPFMPGEQEINAAKAAALDLINDTLARLHADGNAVVAVGMPDDEIARLASRLPADLVVVGRRGRTRLNRIALGSVAETLTRTAPCSVFVVRMQPET